jgi:hypothetical protein
VFGDLGGGGSCRLTDRTPHESLPVETKVVRQWLRIVTSDVSIWFKRHSTANPLCALPASVSVIEDNKFGLTDYEAPIAPFVFEPVHSAVLGAVLALAPLQLPAYVILWIVNYLPWSDAIPDIAKLRLIERVLATRRRVLEKKKPVSAPAR